MNLAIIKVIMTVFQSRKFALVGLNLVLILALFYPLGPIFGSDKAVSKNESDVSEILVKMKNNGKIYKIKTDNNLGELLNFYQNNPLVEYAEPNYLYEAAILAPNDPFYFEQKYLDQMDVPRAWDQTTGSEDVVIAVLDSGVDIDHADLKENIWQNKKEIIGDGIDNDKNGYVDDINGWDLVLNNNDPRPDFEDGCIEKKTCSRAGVNHGTIIAGLIAARGNNGEGVAGISWRSKIMPLRVLDSAGVGDAFAVAKAIDYAVKNGANIINLSFVGDNYSKTMSEAIRRAYEAGLIIVASAGNDSNPKGAIDLDKEKMYPICYGGLQGENWVIGVASVDYDKRKTSFSNYGHDCVDLSAPGIGFYGTEAYNISGKDFTYPYGGYWSGTSLSAALVSGVAALIKSKNQSLTNNEIINHLLNSADEIDSLNNDFLGKLGRGLVNANKALLSVAGKAVDTSPGALARLVVSPRSNFIPEVNSIDSINKLIRYQFLAYDSSFKGGVSLASGDVDGDGKMEIITGQLAGGIPEIKIFDRRGNLKKQFLAFDKNFKGGINIATADLNSDGIKEILVTPASAGGPQIKVFDGTGRLRLQFFAFSDKFRGGVNLAAGDVDNDGREEIIASPAKDNYPFVRLFDNNGVMKEQFFAFSRDFRGGVNLATSDLNNDGIKEIVVAPVFGGGPQVKILDNLGRTRLQFLAFDKNFKGGVSVASGDVDNDGYDEIIAGAGKGGEPHVRIFDAKGQVRYQFYAYNRDFRGGLNTAVVK